MRTLVLQLYNRKNRPTFSYISNGEEVTALFDSGAEAPVWCAGKVAVCYHPLIGCDFVMSDTMFSKADTYIHRIGKKQIEVLFEKDQYQCAVKNALGTFSIVTFAQEEAEK